MDPTSPLNVVRTPCALLRRWQRYVCSPAPDDAPYFTLLLVNKAAAPGVRSSNFEEVHFDNSCMGEQQQCCKHTLAFSVLRSLVTSCATLARQNPTSSIQRRPALASQWKQLLVRAHSAVIMKGVCIVWPMQAICTAQLVSGCCALCLCVWAHGDVSAEGVVLR